MKTFLLIALILLAVNVYAEEDTLKAVDDNPNADDKDTVAAKSEDDDSQFSEADSDKDALDEALNADMGTNTITKEDIIVIRPGGSRGGGYGGGVTYTRWGKRSCPPRATLVYEGFAAGGWYHQRGNGANYLCMPRDAQYLSMTDVKWPSYLYGAEYETNNKIFSGTTNDYNVPCAVCHVPRSAKLMVPGKYTCPSTWRREYYGYLMTSYHNHYQQILYECVDVYPDLIPGSQGNRNGALFYFVQAVCGYGLPCGPYINKKAITCAVCTK